jgi:hypothetical protein
MTQTTIRVESFAIAIYTLSIITIDTSLYHVTTSCAQLSVGKCEIFSSGSVSAHLVAIGLAIVRNVVD